MDRFFHQAGKAHFRERLGRIMGRANQKSQRQNPIHYHNFCSCDSQSQQQQSVTAATVSHSCNSHSSNSQSQLQQSQQLHKTVDEDEDKDDNEDETAMDLSRGSVKGVERLKTKIMKGRIPRGRKSDIKLKIVQMMKIQI